MIEKSEALELVEHHLPNRNLRKHVYAVEAVMRALAIRLGQDAEVWGLTGLLHDLDYAETASTPEKHAYVTVEMLGEQLPKDALHAILAHPEHVPQESMFDWALFCADPVTGLIVAAALMHPEKKLSAIDLSFLKRRFDEKRFAAGANRDAIRSCEHLGISLDEFLDLALKAMQGIAKELEL